MISRERLWVLWLGRSERRGAPALAPVSPLVSPSLRINAPNAGPMSTRGTNPGTHRYRTVTPEEPGQAGPPLPLFPHVARAEAALRAGNKSRLVFF